MMVNKILTILIYIININILRVFKWNYSKLTLSCIASHYFMSLLVSNNFKTFEYYYIWLTKHAFGQMLVLRHAFAHKFVPMHHFSIQNSKILILCALAPNFHSQIYILIPKMYLILILLGKKALELDCIIYQMLDDLEHVSLIAQIPWTWISNHDRLYNEWSSLYYF